MCKVIIIIDFVRLFKERAEIIQRKSMGKNVRENTTKVKTKLKDINRLSEREREKMLNYVHFYTYVSHPMNFARERKKKA